jgi:hypothetical protein
MEFHSEQKPLTKGCMLHDKGIPPTDVILRQWLLGVANRLDRHTAVPSGLKTAITLRVFQFETVNEATK